MIRDADVEVNVWVMGNVYDNRKFTVNHLIIEIAIISFTIIANNGCMRMEWLKYEMQARGLKARHIAEAIGLNDGQMSLVLSGKRKLSAMEADNIRRYLGYTLPDDEASELDRRLLRSLSRMSEERKRALEVILEAQADPKLP